MKAGIRRFAVGLAVTLALFVVAAGPAGQAALTLSAAQAPLPNPVLMFLRAEMFETGGKAWTKYQFGIANAEKFPAELFAAAPALPPCGLNTKASRTWVDFFDQRGARLNGFCALASSKEPLWFVLERDVVPPSWIYIELFDRQTETRYKSNLAETTLAPRGR